MSEQPMSLGHGMSHRGGVSSWGPPGWDVLRVGSPSRRWFLQGRD